MFHANSHALLSWNNQIFSFLFAVKETIRVHEIFKNCTILMWRLPLKMRNLFNLSICWGICSALSLPSYIADGNMKQHKQIC